MTTCRELVGTDQLQAREKSHRDPLKLREKQLRASSDVGELFQLLEDCELELTENDSVLRKVRQLYLSKEEEVHKYVEQKLQSKRNPTCRLLSSLLSQTVRFGPTPLAGRLQSALEARTQSHRTPLAVELDQTIRLRDLAHLRTKMNAELPPQDELFLKVTQMERNRQTERAQLTAKFKTLVSAKKWKLSHISSLLKEASEELEDGDALVEQIKSLLETKMQQDQGLKPVREVERKSSSGDSKTLSKRSAASTANSKKKPIQSNSSLSQVAGGAKSLIVGFAHDLTGAPSQSSSMYKLGILICFLMYMAVVSYSGSLAIKVAKVDLPDVGTSVQQLAESFKLRKSTAIVAPELAAVEPAPPAAAAAATAAGEETEEEEKGGGGGDEEEED